jgi:16S rRNA (cytosine1402-N4)-methyltransferase
MDAGDIPGMAGADAPHVPVLTRELLAAADVRPGDVVVDGTFGAGGHAALLAARLDGRGAYWGIDRDANVEQHWARFAAANPDVAAGFVRASFPDGMAQLREQGVSADVVILDVGVSSMQLDEPDRGFAYSYDAPLDMRMDRSGGPSAADLLNEWSARDLAAAFSKLGEERHAGRIASAIVQRRKERPFERTGDLVELIRAAVPQGAQRKDTGHPARRVFQALRIVVNDELDMLDRGLDAAHALLAPGGRLVVIAFHSLEDRIVKRRFDAWADPCICPPGLPVCGCGRVASVEPIVRRAATAQDDELAANVRAKPAKLRAVRRITAAGDEGAG